MHQHVPLDGVPLPVSEIETLEAEERALTAEIDAAFWHFTRCRNAKPPTLVCPEAYTRRNEVRQRLAVLRRGANEPRR